MACTINGGPFVVAALPHIADESRPQEARGIVETLPHKPFRNFVGNASKSPISVLKTLRTGQLAKASKTIVPQKNVL